MDVATTSDLREWLVRHYHDYAVADKPVKGTYGLIWFLSRKDSISGVFAVKTLAPEALTNPKSASDMDYLRREFRMWLALPPHLNVIPALGFESARVPADQDGKTVSLPVMRMPKMAGSLQEWVDGSAWGIEDRLIALAQAFNGLLHLYRHGFEGHGDLKPSNILYADLRDRFGLDAGNTWPSISHPWQIRIADLGWADAWIDLGFANKALRQYLAPERLGGRVIPFKSDVFSMGIVAAELLQRRHPASNLKKVRGSEGKWKRWVETGDWNLDGIRSRRLQQLILECLHFDHTRRPTPEECLTEICSELRETYGQNIEPILQHWNEQSSSIADHEHAGWAAAQTIGLGVQETARSIEELERRIKGVAVRDLEACESWMTLARPLINLLEREERPDSVSKIGQLRESAKVYLRTVLGTIDRSSLDSITARVDLSKMVQPFERFAEAIGNVADIAGVRYESEAAGAGGLGPLALAALAFSNASLAHWESDGSEMEKYFLSEAIRHAPEESVPYYFRASWSWMRWTFSSALEHDANPPSADELGAWVVDLELASRLSPTWEEPKNLLRSLHPPHISSQ